MNSNSLFSNSLCALAAAALLLPADARADGGASASTSEYGTNRAPIQTFYVPLPEEHAYDALRSIWGDYKTGTSMFGAPASPMESYVSIAIFLDNTVIYYDQWENGYERDIANPNHPYGAMEPLGTQIWGDGDPSNGYPPGFPSDRFWAGDTISLHSTVALDRIGQAAFFDGCDKFASTKPIAATRTVWASESKTLFAGANEMYDTSYFGDEFVCPVGENIAANDQYEIFEYVGLSIMAGPGGATISIDKDNNGAFDTLSGGATSITLAEGEPYLVDGGVKLGGRVVATEGSVQVELVTGDVFDGYESRFMKLLPRRLWASAYTCPVAAPLNVNNSSCGSKIWIYNPGSTRLTVTCKSTAKTQTLTVAPGSYAYVIPAPKPSTTGFGTSSQNANATYTGALSGTYLTADAPFYAICTVDCVGTTASTTKSAGVNRTWDWGFTLIPDSSLSSQVVVGLGLGRDPTSTVNPDENAAPVWVTAPQIADGKSRTTVYVKYPHKGTVESFTLSALEMKMLYDSGDQTGVHVWTEDGTKIAAAWGSDPAKATAGQPGLDMGTGIPPMPELFMQKSSRLASDPDGDSFTAGDTIEYTVEIMNVGHIRINDITLKDTLPEGVAYVPGSFAVEAVEGASVIRAKRTISDALFDQVVNGGLAVCDYPEASEQILHPGQSWLYTYSVTIEPSARVSLHNVAVVDSGATSLTNSVTDYLRARIGDRVWLDADGDGIQDDGEIGLPYATVSLVDAETGYLITDDFDRPYSMVTDATGAYLFKGVRPGSYRVVVSVPAAYAPTVPGAVSNLSETDSDIGQTAVDGLYTTGAFAVVGGDVRLDIDAGFVVRDGCASIALVKTAGGAADGDTLEVDSGDTVTYTYKFTNTGAAPLKDVTVTDDKIAGWSFTFDGVLAPGETAVATATAKVRASVTNVGTVVGTPTDAQGHDLPGIDGTVTASDDAIVTVTAEPATVGDRVWADLDGDGVQDEGEPGLSGVTVTLKDANGNVVASTTTDASGNYLFKDVPASSYTVVFASPDDVYEFTTKDAGSDDAADSDANAAGAAAVTVAEGDVNLTIDAGLKLKGGAAAIAIVKLAGDAADGTSLQLARYGDTATYTYIVTNTGLAHLVNVVVTDDKLGSIGTIASLAPGASATLTASASLTTNTTNVATVTATPKTKAGDAIPGAPSVTASDDAVVLVPLQTATIGDRVWIDANGDGIQDAIENGLHGVVVSLKDANDNVVATATTDENGNYLFTDVVPGTYTVVFEAPVDWTFATKDVGSDDAADSDADAAGEAAVTVAPGATDLTIDAGLVLASGAAAIDIVKTVDDAADGETLRTAEIGATVTYYYTVANIGHTYLKDVTITDDKLGAIGSVAGILPPGATAVLTRDAIINEDTVNIGTATGTPCDANGDVLDTDYVSADDDAIVDVPDEPAAIGDRAWIDLDGDGIQDVGEPGLPGVTVTLKDHTGAVVARTVTDANGNYLFADVNPGNYTVTFAPAESWWKPTRKDAGGNDAADSDINAAGVTGSFTLVSLADDLTRDAGFVFNASAASIAITKTASETAIGKGESVTYTYVVTNTGSTHLKDVAVTDDKLGPIGTIALLAPGASQTLTATAVLTEDTTNVGTATGTPANSTGTPIPGASAVTDDDTATVAVNTDPAVIGDRVWNDADGDGVQDDGEMGVYGITVMLRDLTNAVVKTTTTDANGNYLFENVDPGTYVVEFSFASGSGWSFTTKDAGGNDAADSDADPATGRTAPFAVAAGESNLTIDAGLVGGVPPGICELVDLANKFNAFIGGDFRADGGDSEGNLFVAGDARVGMGFSVGLIGPGYGRTRNAAPLGIDAFVVAGSLSEETQPDINGNIVYGGTYTNLINADFDARPYELRHVPVVTFDAAWNVPADASGKSIASVKAGLDTFSAVVAALGERGDPQYDGPYPELYDPNVIWTADDPFRSVFVITNDVFTLTSAGLIIDVPEGTKAVVNILARDVQISWSTITLIGTDPTKVIYNFPNATSIVVNGCNFEGSVFAPKADVRMNGAAVNGFAYFGGDVSFENGAEFHDFAFRAFDCSPYFAMRPTMRLSVTAGNAADGAVLPAVAGEDVEITEIVANTGDYAISEVTLVDVLGRRLFIGDLAAGAAVTNKVVVQAGAAGVATYAASAQGTSLDERATPYLGTTITASDSAQIEVFETAASRDAAIAARLAANVRAACAYQPRPDLEVVSLEFVGGAPTLTNELFAVRVRVANSGEIATRTGRLSVYVGAPDPVDPGTPATRSVDLRGTGYETLQPGESFEYVFSGLRTPADGGACHVRVLIDADGVIEELSEGNNQLPVFAWLTPITLATSVDSDYVGLSWNCYAGQTYTICVSTSLTEGWFDFDGRVEIVAPDGAVTVTDGLAIPADESGTVTVRIPITAQDVAGFFKLRVNLEGGGDRSDIK